MTKPKDKSLASRKEYQKSFNMAKIADRKLPPIKISDEMQNIPTLYVHESEKSNRKAEHTMNTCLFECFQMNPEAANQLLFYINAYTTNIYLYSNN